MSEWGVWSNPDGGFIEVGFFTQESAEAAHARMLADGEFDGYGEHEFPVIEVCEVHEEQPKDDCEECMTEADEALEEEET